MGKNGGFNFKEFDKLQRQLEDLTGETHLFIEACSKELAARLLAKVMKRTPVGDYGKRAKQGGTLRRGWTAKTYTEAETGGKSNAIEYAKNLQINKVGNAYVIEIINPVEYASYVEFGHRIRGGKGRVKGKFMLTLSENEIQKSAPHIIENKIKKFMEGYLK